MEHLALLWPLLSVLCLKAKVESLELQTSIKATLIALPRKLMNCRQLGLKTLCKLVSEYLFLLTVGDAVV